MNNATVASIVDAYIASRQLLSDTGMLTRGSQYQTQLYVNDFAAFVGRDKPASAVKTADIASWILASPRYRSSHTKSSACGHVVCCWHWAAEHDLIPAACQLHRPKRLYPSPRPREPMTNEEFRRLWVAVRRCDGHGFRSYPTRDSFRLAILLLRYSGCRTCEMREARWENLDWSRSVIELDQHKTVKVTGQTRLIPIRRHLLRLLRTIYEQRRPRSDGHIFTNSRHVPWTKSSFTVAFRRFARLAGIREEVSAYSIRHNVCVRLIERGRSDREIASVLGHAGVRLISWYGRGVRSNAEFLVGVLER